MPPELFSTGALESMAKAMKPVVPAKRRSGVHADDEGHLGTGCLGLSGWRLSHRASSRSLPGETRLGGSWPISVSRGCPGIPLIRAAVADPDYQLRSCRLHLPWSHWARLAAAACSSSARQVPEVTAVD